MTEEHKNKISKSRKERKNRLGYLNSPETRVKIRIANTGKKQSLETIEKRFKNCIGKNRPPFSEEWKKNMSKSQKGKVGYKSSAWKGGISKNKKHIREVRNKNERKRRDKKLGASGFHTQGEWENLKAQYNWTCPCCKKFEPEIKLTEDHIIPLSKGGSDNIENIQPLCRSCNSRKHTKIIKY